MPSARQNVTPRWAKSRHMPAAPLEDLDGGRGRHARDAVLDVVVDPVADRLHALHPRLKAAEQLPRLVREQVGLAEAAGEQPVEELVGERLDAVLHLARPGHRVWVGRDRGERVVGERRGSLAEARAAGSGCRRGRRSSSPRAPARCSSARRAALPAIRGAARRARPPAVGAVASCSNRQPTRSLSASRSGRCCCCCCGCWLGGPSSSRACARGGGSSSTASVCVVPPIACVITAPRRNCRIAPRFWIATSRAIGSSSLPRSCVGSDRRRRATRSSPARRARPGRRPGRCRVTPRRRRSRGRRRP